MGPTRWRRTCWTWRRWCWTAFLRPYRSCRSASRVASAYALSAGRTATFLPAHAESLWGTSAGPRSTHFATATEPFALCQAWPFARLAENELGPCCNGAAASTVTWLPRGRTQEKDLEVQVS